MTRCFLDFTLLCVNLRLFLDVLTAGDCTYARAPLDIMIDGYQARLGGHTPASLLKMPHDASMSSFTDAAGIPPRRRASLV